MMLHSPEHEPQKQDRRTRPERKTKIDFGALYFTDMAAVEQWN